jgi:short-subunit dehydrogenase
MQGSPAPDTRSIVVTGASSGIGAALARHAAASGWRVLLVARRADRLATLADEIRAAGGVCETLVADVVAPDAPRRIVDAALRAFGRIDVVVNNAGHATAGNLLDTSDAAIERQWQLHVAAPLRIARESLSHVRTAHGGFVFVGSGVARVPIPAYGAYCAAKAAIRAAATQLRRELRPAGVFVTYVDPGVVATEFSQASGMTHAPQSWYAKPETVAQRIMQGIDRRHSRVNAVPWQTAMTIAGEWLPSLADRVIPYAVPPPAASTVTPEARPAPAWHPEPVEGSVAPDPLEQALQPLQRRMERVNLSPAFVRSLLIPGTTIELNDAAMRWAGMPNKNERAALHEVLDALAAAAFLEATGEERWHVLRAAT